MNLPELVQVSSTWLLWGALALSGITLISFIIGWGAKFRLVGATIFTFLLAVSTWAFAASYKPPLDVEGAIYAPVVFDNGDDLVVAQASLDFPEEAIEPSIKKIAGNIKGGGRKGGIVHVRLRQVQPVEDGISRPVILTEVVRDLSQELILPVPQKNNG
ncbi:DUF2518 family protein [Prochlorococcus sp. MIT 1300]|uniref:DUF2518 family protein n=1 Tax=Prochlorococcus sp. MIT 1300 TaxID=3096218 RepID=UPI002A750AC8|nr:DUF2518 family protein [Prochlorococcus sp. MIT 1300]